MCYEIALTKRKNQVQEYFNTDFVLPQEYKPYYPQAGYPSQITHHHNGGAPKDLSWNLVLRSHLGNGGYPGFQKKI